MMHDAFSDITFSDPEQAAPMLDTLLAGQPPAFSQALARALADASDPQTVVIRLHGYAELDGAAGQFACMAREPHCLALAVRLFDQSQFLTDCVFREPAILPWLWTDAPRARAREREDLLAELRAMTGDDADFEAAARSLRRLRNREMVRIAIRDIVDHAPLASVTLDLSALADAALDAARNAARADLMPRHGLPRNEAGEETPFAILGMGKLGGRELNYSSDIDLLFIYREDGETDGPARLTNHEYFKKLGERIIRAVSEQTAEGRVFRIDMRLRPFGSAGPLAVSFDGALEYYIAYGRAWERQALIKARPCAGDIALGDAFLERLRPFVYPRYFDDATLEDIRDTKRQAEEQIARKGVSEREVKLGRGGIRDIEFTVQMLQLLNGGAMPELRTRNTLYAIDALGRVNLLSPFQANTLASNYIFLRTVEHRLQIEGAQQRHALPADARRLDLIAKRLGYADGAGFMRVYEDRTRANRAILEQFLAAQAPGNLWLNELLDPHAEAPEALAHLERLGFADARGARAELLRLTVGPEGRPYPLNVRQQFAAIAPGLIRALSVSANPDRALLRISGMLSTVRAPAAMYQVLELDPKLHDYLVALASNSEYLTAIITRDPGLLDMLGSQELLERPDTRASLEEELAFLEGAYDAAAALYRLRDGATLRIGMRELVCGIAVTQVGDELTLLAEVILERALREARETLAGRFGMPPVPIAILGLGKLGGWEMGYGSDLDVVFVYDGEAEADGVSVQEYAGAVAAKVIQRLKEYTPYGKLYDIDARLRPDGNKGLLAVSRRRIHDYYAGEAMPWERMALMKARAVAGDGRFGTRVECAAKDLAFSLPLSRETLHQIEDLRLRHTAQAGEFDLKHAEGGLSEVEFTTRLWQIKHAPQYPELKRGDVFGALDILLENALEPAELIEPLYEAYGRLRHVLNRIRMMHGSQDSAMPGDIEARRELGRRLGIAADLGAYVQGYREQVHAVYEAVRGSILEN
jgi:glutamate-ammonia-ligase adenylyltransferase